MYKNLKKSPVLSEKKKKIKATEHRTFLVLQSLLLFLFFQYTSYLQHTVDWHSGMTDNDVWTVKDVLNVKRTWFLLIIYSDIAEKRWCQFLQKSTFSSHFLDLSLGSWYSEVDLDGSIIHWCSNSKIGHWNRGLTHQWQNQKATIFLEPFPMCGLS